MPAPLFLSIVEFPGDGVTTTWEFDFAGGYISRDHVKALVRDEFGAPAELVIAPEDFITDFTLSIEPAVPVGSTLRIYRDTPREEPLVNFTGGSNFTEANLDLLARQTIMVAAEAFDAGSYAEAFDLLGQAQTAASQAAAALAAAITSQAETAIAAGAAADSAALALVRENAATASANLAAASAAAAALSETAALAAAAAALVSQNDAADSRDLAGTAAGQAATSAVNAEASDTAAALSAVNAAASAAAADVARAAAVVAQVAAEAAAAAAALFDPANYVPRTDIVGTVTGDGLGAIIEQGSNANGDWTRWEDGTQVCRFLLDVGSTTSAGAGTYSDPYRTAAASWTFPQAFSAVPMISATGTSNGTLSYNRALVASFESVTTTAVNTIVLVKVTSSSVSNSGAVHLIAYGRWL